MWRDHADFRDGLLSVGWDLLWSLISLSNKYEVSMFTQYKEKKQRKM